MRSKNIRLEVPVKIVTYVLVSVEVPREWADRVPQDEHRSVKNAAEQTAADYLDRKLGSWAGGELIAAPRADWRFSEIGADRGILSKLSPVSARGIR